MPNKYFFDYFKVHSRYMEPFIRRMKQGNLDVNFFESKLPLIFFKLHKVLAGILTETEINNDLQKYLNEKSERNYNKALVDTVLQFQN